MKIKSKEAVFQAEQSVLGGLLLDPDRIADITQIIETADFVSHEHQAIYLAILDKVKKGLGVDVVTLGGDHGFKLSYLAEIAKNTPSAANIQSYAKIVKSESKKRRFRILVDEAKKRIDDDEDEGEIINWLRSETQPTDKTLGLLEWRGVWGNIDFRSITPRPWLLPPIFMRGAVAALLSPGGVGKSVFSIVLSIVVATGRPILGDRFRPVNRANVAVLNNEDSNDEMIRRVAAISVHHDIEFSDLDDKLFVFSGYGNPFTVSQTMPDGMTITTPHVEELKKFIINAGIRVLIIDPFISTHDSEENSNNEIDRVIGIYRVIAHETGVAILLVHHTRKTGGDSESHAGNPESARGAGALINSCRMAFTLAAMSKSTAENYNFNWDIGRRLRRFDDAKSNYSLADECATWLEMKGVCLDNASTENVSDWVGVPVPFDFETAATIAEMESEGKNKKWTAHKYAAALNEFCMEQSDPSQVFWSEIQPEICERLKIGKTASNEYLKSISNNQDKPTRIKNINGQLIEFWTEKSGPYRTARTLIKRREL